LPETERQESQKPELWILRLPLTAPRRMTVGGFVISIGFVISSEGRNLVLGGLRSCAAHKSDRDRESS